MNSSSIDWALLKGVSRSFYLTLRILPAPVRESIALAYLAARVSDTLADGATSAAERRLLERQGEIERWIADSPDRREIESVWATIREGQDFDRSRFSHSGAIPLSDEELDRYTYHVAGCVGAFWTKLCAKKMPGFSSRDHATMTSLGIRFGKGLQLVNILRDRSADFAKGRIYVPSERFNEVLEEARVHLLSAMDYVRALRNYRLRVACALPLFLAHETLDLIASDPSAARPKVSRRRVWVLLARAVVVSLRGPFRLPA
ncbi:MAG: squalene/phytoene synthase family protein [Terrimicrobiaceae bacterium]